ncbi:single-stranded DNA-binding protein [[Clostridium] aminophilum]|uniref:single-stranded DNA-binding protein n=1 Tax=[Clostridium] aminophilum TaxID=1526 RepID=UPI003F9E6668
MNSVTVSGRICCVPKIRLLQMGGKTVNVCNFTIASVDGMAEDELHNSQNTDFFECICLNREAITINSKFMKGSKILAQGKLKNHFFEDGNKTKHFTNVLLLTHVEFGDTASACDRDQNTSLDLSIESNVNDIKALYETVCDNGYLCVDEDEYYRIAMDNFC